MRYIHLIPLIIFILSCKSNQSGSEQVDNLDTLTNFENKGIDTEINIVEGTNDTLIVNDKILILKPISASSFQAFPHDDFKEPESEMINDKSNVKRDLLNLTFKLKNGNDTVLRNDTTESYSKYIDYQFLNSYDFFDYWLISLTYYEGFEYMLLDKENGEHIIIWSIPSFSPDNSRFLCYSFDLEAGYNANGLQSFKIVDKKAVLDWSLEINDWGPTKIKWQNDTTVLIEQTTINPESDEFYSKSYKQMIIK